MGVLRIIQEWWRGLWECDWSWEAGSDSHQWDNKVEILRRLSSGSY
jgi:hypothetical protein